MKTPSALRQADLPQFVRLHETGRAAIEFFIDGQACQALAGDTVLTAVLTNQGAVRRTEFSGQLRAGLCLMGACQDCWISLESGQRIRACSTMLQSGMRVVTSIDKDA